MSCLGLTLMNVGLLMAVAGLLTNSALGAVGVILLIVGLFCFVWSQKRGT